MATTWRWLGRLYRWTIRVVFGVALEPLPCWLGWRHQLVRWLYIILFGPLVHDAGSRFKLFRREIFRRIPLQSEGEFVHFEVLAKANFLSCVMAEVVLDWKAIPPVEPWRTTFGEARRVLARPEFRAEQPPKRSAARGRRS
jgi:hypothetical protein